MTTKPGRLGPVYTMSELQKKPTVQCVKHVLGGTTTIL